MEQETAAPDWRSRLTTLWAEGIPLATAMGIEIRRLDEEMLVLAAPLAPNRNHMGTAFGGSLQGIAILAGWGVTMMTVPQGVKYVIIRNSQMRFIEPVSGELLAEALLPSPGAVAAFRTTLAQRGHARLTVPVVIRGPTESVAARFVGEFVAFAERTKG